MTRDIGGWEFFHIHYFSLWLLTFLIVVAICLSFGPNGRDKK